MSRNAFDTPSLYEQIIATITNSDIRGMLIWYRCFWCLPITSSRPQKVRVLCTKYNIFFLYLWQHNLVFKKFLEVTRNNLNNNQPHPITMTLSHCRCQNQNLQTPKDYQHNCHLYFTTTGSTITATQPQCHQHCCCHYFHLHHSINSPPSLTNIVLT